MFLSTQPEDRVKIFKMVDNGSRVVKRLYRFFLGNTALSEKTELFIEPEMIMLSCVCSSVCSSGLLVFTI